MKMTEHPDMMLALKSMYFLIAFYLEGRVVCLLLKKPCLIWSCLISSSWYPTLLL